MMKRLLLAGASALATGLGLAACVTPAQRAADIAHKCEAASSYVEIAQPAHAQAYRDAAGARLAQRLSRGWPFETHWYGNAAERKTILCNLAPAYNADRRGDHCISNQTVVHYQETPAGPVMLEDSGVICLD